MARPETDGASESRCRGQGLPAAEESAVLQGATMPCSVPSSCLRHPTEATLLKPLQTGYSRCSQVLTRPHVAEQLHAHGHELRLCADHAGG